jgi:hypothetical protein
VLPPKIAQRLRLGRSVAAEIQPVSQEHRAWVHVEPILDPQLGHMEQTEPGIEPILVSSREDSALLGFRVRRREIHRRFEECPDDWDLVGLSLDEVQVVKTEEELATLLTTWHIDLNALTLPHNVSDPF